MSQRKPAIMILIYATWVAAGCSGSTGTLPPPGALTPITVDEWRDLDPSEKYDPATFDRLKLNDPKLQNEQEWERFMKTVVLPERKIEIPLLPSGN